MNNNRLQPIVSQYLVYHKQNSNIKHDSSANHMNDIFAVLVLRENKGNVVVTYIMSFGKIRNGALWEL